MSKMPLPKKNESALNESLGPSISDELSVPEHFDKPILNDMDKDLSSETVVKPLKSAKPIEVVALRKGFYNQNRINEGDKFFIKSEEDFGEWFKCVDVDLEKHRLQFIKNKKANK